MSADHSEARERARQEFEQAAKGVFTNPPEGIDPFRTRGDGSYFWGNVESAWQLWQARGRSLEKERDELLNHALECMNRSCTRCNVAMKERYLTRVHKGDS